MATHYRGCRYLFRKRSCQRAIYHSAGVQEDWIVNIESQRIERFPFFGTSELQPPSLITAGMQASIRVGRTDLAIDVKQIFA
jgi:hypothetical protein